MLQDTADSHGIHTSHHCKSCSKVSCLNRRITWGLWCSQNKANPSSSTGGCSPHPGGKDGCANCMPDTDWGRGYRHVIALCASAPFSAQISIPSMGKQEGAVAHSWSQAPSQLHPGRLFVLFIVCLFIFRWLFRSLVTQLVSNRPGRFLLLPSWLLAKQQSVGFIGSSSLTVAASKASSRGEEALLTAASVWDVYVYLGPAPSQHCSTHSASGTSVLLSLGYTK